MENTYITRRIDELGRFVIPKEIRKNLKIKDNDQLEINVIENKIVLNKYENVKSDKIISLIISILKKNINKNVIFTSRDTIIDYSLINKEIISNKSLNEEIMNIIEKRKVLYNNGSINLSNTIINVFYSINPIIINGDIYGSLIVYGNEDFQDKEKDIIQFVRIFLENYLE